MAWWWAHGLTPTVVDDGLSGDAQFNRHRAYNHAVASHPDVDVFIFTEADMLLPIHAVEHAVEMAHEQPGLVVPFTQYRYMSDETTAQIRNQFHDWTPEELMISMHNGYPFGLAPESTMEQGKSIGAVNVMSRQTLEMTGGFTEATSGNWYDDRIIEEGFKFLTGQPTRWVDGPAVHLYHLPGWSGEHLTEADKEATRRNRDLLVRMRADVRMKRRMAVRNLMGVRA
jgi:hypothetical protein